MKRSLGFVLATTFLVAGCTKQPPTTVPSGSAHAEEEESEEVPVAVAQASAEEPSVQAPESFESILSAKDRTQEDRALDAGRKPGEMLAFFQIAPGMQVADLAAGGGYTTELLARVVGPEGRVYSQNNKFVIERFAQEPWTTRLAKPVNTNVIRVETELEAPLPGVADLDAVTMILFYHDSVWFKTDRAKMNRAIFAALKPGGVFGIVDHSARPGDGVAEAKTLHRIEESVLVQEVEAAGFVLEAEADFLRNPDDARDWSASPSQAGDRRGTSDRFVLRFRKPKTPVD